MSKLSSGISTSRLFLIDGIGALVSAAFLGIVLVQLESLIGMPVDVLYLLALLALLFAAYSFTCYTIKSTNKRLLRIIAIINSCYCLLTLSLVIMHFHRLTLLAIVYFILEMSVIIGLVSIEWKVSSKTEAVA